MLLRHFNGGNGLHARLPRGRTLEIECPEVLELPISSECTDWIKLAVEKQVMSQMRFCFQKEIPRLEITFHFRIPGISLTLLMLLEYSSYTNDLHLFQILR